MAITDYSTTASSNTSISGINIAEGWPAANINNSIRQLMADIATECVTNTKTANLTKAINYAKATDLASGSTTNIAGIDGNNVNITGTTTITAFGTAQAGAVRFVRFNGILTLTHNATSLILPGGASITTAAGDTATFISKGSGNWECYGYKRAAAGVDFDASGAAAAVLPSQTGNSGKYLTTNGSAASWGTVTTYSLPTQTGNSGKALVTNGTAESWGYPAQLSTASGSMPSYSARAWGVFNGSGTPAFVASGNFSSITDNGTGDYTLNFTTAMPTNEYSCVFGGGSTASSLAWAYSKETTYVRVRHATPSSLTDGNGISVAIFM